MWSAKRYRALDETAVFGYCCHHDFSGKFINLKHGEKWVCLLVLLQGSKIVPTCRLAYGVYMLEKITGTTDSNVFVMYDIACSLTTHLKVYNSNLIFIVIILLYFATDYRSMAERKFWKPQAFVSQLFTVMDTSILVRLAVFVCLFVFFLLFVCLLLFFCFVLFCQGMSEANQNNFNYFIVMCIL